LKSLRDIAKLCNCGKDTVSRVFKLYRKTGDVVYSKPKRKPYKFPRAE
jgi:transposase